MMIVVSIVVLFVTTVVVFLRVASRRRKLYEFAKTLPGPETWPIIGNLLMFAVPRKDLFMSFNKVHSKYDSPTRYWIGPLLYVAIDKPDDIEAVMTSSIASDKGYIYKIMRESIGNGLIQLNGPKHRIHRKLMSLPLKGTILEKQIEKFDQKGRECVSMFNEHVDKKSFNVIEYVERCAMALVSETILGIRINSNDSQNCELIKVISSLYQSISERMYKIWLHPMIIYRFTKHYAEHKKNLMFFNKLLNQYVHDKMEVLEKENKEDSDWQNISLEWLIHSKDDNGKPTFSSNEIREELITLYTASEDTTATVTSFALLMLAIHEDIQEKVWMEQKMVMEPNGDPNTPIQPQDLKNMVYLDMVIHEVLRLFPVAPIITRKLNDDMQIGKIKVPKEANILISSYFAHRNEQIWKEPEKFDPLRFTTEEKAKRHTYSYIPFSGGIRSCLGKQFAYIAIKCFLSNIIRNYSLHSHWSMDDIKLESDISIRSINGYYIYIKKRIQ